MAGGTNRAASCFETAFRAEFIIGPRFALESDAAIAAIPPAYVDEARGRMRCVGDRCSALAGEVGVATACRVYVVRADVCRECKPGDAACTMARQRFNLPALLSAR